ncbi:hypothetical protein COCON_G00052250 [Conger conger]|uniref:Kazal-like domain-containing protein n=1 Tax=Conger conger TaxID=82655 RepID=A0A9Q1I5P2_CONCO|nr:trypsin inhibitor ClTI-1-like [Conger conger]XP_061092559.1 trypsin inhibitor ClTI-1-like [Conger conger]XP_061092560.1 trypsin inhibitor ClTI-1-like [Conger conger]KAJ8282706.1 hypothetical protein COCON_G00052250 [Conger conger]
MRIGTRLVVLFCFTALVTVSAAPSTPIAPNCSAYFLPMCTRDFSPVCGNDGVTYSNDCMLCLWNKENQANIAIAWKGECE